MTEGTKNAEPKLSSAEPTPSIGDEIVVEFAAWRKARSALTGARKALDAWDAGSATLGEALDRLADAGFDAATARASEWPVLDRYTKSEGDRC